MIQTQQQDTASTPGNLFEPALEGTRIEERQVW